MSRLIDADKLIEEIWGKHKEAEIYAESIEEVKDAYCEVVSIIDDLPTAYDVDKVVSKMETEIEENQDASLSEYRAGLYKAIEIVKAGGLNASKENC